jgi:hypothetical protein
MKKFLILAVTLIWSISSLFASDIPSDWKRFGSSGNAPKMTGNNLELSGIGSGISWKVPVIMNFYYKVSVKATASGGKVTGYLLLKASNNNRSAKIPLKTGSDGKFVTTADVIRTNYGKGVISVEAFIKLTKCNKNTKLLIKSISIEQVIIKRTSSRHRKVTLKGKYLVPKLRDYCLKTNLSEAVIVAGKNNKDLAVKIQKAIEDKIGKKIAIIDEKDAKIPYTTNVIALGNRSSNRFIWHLYNRMYTLLDVKYPGPGGYVIRTLHNTFANGKNVVFLGGSNKQGTIEAVKCFLNTIEKTSSKDGDLVIGRQMTIKLPAGTKLPEPLKYSTAYFWSKVNRGSKGYGWNIIAYNMAMYYMTGIKKYAKTAARLSLQPTKKDYKDLLKYDLGSFDNHKTPLSHPYHYFAHNMMIFWDLIEESDAFSDSEKLGITRQLAEQISSKQMNYPYIDPNRPSYYLDRHGIIATFSFYCTARYFNKYYPNRHWTKGLKGVRNRFSYINQKNAYQRGESGNLVRSFSGWITPAILYLTTTDNMNIVKGGRLSEMLSLYEALFDGSDSMIATSSTNNILKKIANLTGKGKWLYYAQQTPLKPSGVFRVGQSFAPGAEFKVELPEDIMDKFIAVKMPLQILKHYAYKHLKAPYSDCYVTIAYRNGYGKSGDYVAFDSLREITQTPYNMNSILALRVNGTTILRGYGNYVQVNQNGKVPMDIPQLGKVKDFGVFKNNAYIKTKVPEMSWERSVVFNKRRYALIADKVTAEEDGEVGIILNWQGPKTTQFKSKKNKIWCQVSNCIELENTAIYPKTLEVYGTANQKRIKSTRVGDSATFSFFVAEDTACNLMTELKTWNYGANKFKVELDGKLLDSNVCNWSRKPEYSKVINLGKINIKRGKHTLKFTVLEKKKGAKNAWIAIQKTFFKKNVKAYICTAEAMSGILGDSNAYHKTSSKLKKGESRTVFSLLAVGENFDCKQITQNAALLFTPEKALAFNGNFRNFGSAYLAVIDKDHIFAVQAVQIANIFKSSIPLDLSWNLKTGLLEIKSNKDTTIQINGKTLSIKKGKNVFQKVFADVEATNKFSDDFAKLKNGHIPEKQFVSTLNKLKYSRKTRIPGTFTRNRIKPWGTYLPEVVNARWKNNPALAIATNQRVYITDLKGKLLKIIDIGAEVTKVYYWEKAGLLLLGNEYRKVIAFNQSNSKKVWTFQSKADDSIKKKFGTWSRVYKSIWSMSSGKFPAEKEYAFIGSSSGIELLDANGKLFKRYPVLYGVVRKMLVIKKPNGSKQLLALGSNQAYYAGKLWGIDAKTSKGIRQNNLGFTQFVPGYCKGLGISTGGSVRTVLFYEDFDADGKKDIMTDLQRYFKLFAIYEVGNLAYKPLYQINLGPGSGAGVCDMPPPTSIICADIQGSKTPEIIYCDKYGKFAAINGKCKQLWNLSLEFIPKYLCAVPKTNNQDSGYVLAAGGRYLALVDGKGKLLSQSKLKSRISVIHLMPDGKTVFVLLKTGQILYFKIKK